MGRATDAAPVTDHVLDARHNGVWSIRQCLTLYSATAPATGRACHISLLHQARPHNGRNLSLCITEIRRPVYTSFRLKERLKLCTNTRAQRSQCKLTYGRKIVDLNVRIEQCLGNVRNNELSDSGAEGGRADCQGAILVEIGAHSREGDDYSQRGDTAKYTTRTRMSTNTYFQGMTIMNRIKIGIIHLRRDQQLQYMEPGAEEGCTGSQGAVLLDICTRSRDGGVDECFLPVRRRNPKYTRMKFKSSKRMIFAVWTNS